MGSIEVMIEERFGITDTQIKAIRGDFELAIAKIRTEFYADLEPLFWKVISLLVGASLVYLLLTLPLYSIPGLIFTSL